MKHLKNFILVASIVFLPKIANAKVVELSERQLFEKVCRGYDYTYKGDKPCVLLFHNGTCPFAKQIDRFLEKLSKKKEYKNKIYFYKVNVWRVSDKTLEDFELEGVPTTFFFRTDGNIDYDLGMLDVEDLERQLKWLLRRWY